MGFLAAVREWIDPPLETRSEEVPASLADFVARLQGSRASTWRLSSVREAMGVPAVYGAVTLISNTIGSLTMKGYRQGEELPDVDRPRLIIRPDPFTIPRDFFRDTAFNLATRGEAWWWIAARDIDGQPLSLLNMHPREVIVTENPRDLRFPVVEWRGRRMRNDDVRQITYNRDPESGNLRGFGPLQACQAAISVAVESQEWAANFYADGGMPALIIKAAGYLSPEKDENGLNEAERLLSQWISKPNNVPRAIDQAIDSVEYPNVNTNGAQMLDAREYQNIDAARMFNVPAGLLDSIVQGSSLTYQNVSQEMDRFIKRCLRPNFLEPIEQTMSDLLTRATTARFNTKALLQDDIKTLADVYAKLIPLGVYTAELAQRELGITGGDIENAPVPLSVPQAIPSSVAIEQRSEPIEVRCTGKKIKQGRMMKCGRLLGRFVGRYEIVCPSCNTLTASAS